MSLQSRLTLAALSVLATAALAATAADARPGQGRGHQTQPTDALPESLPLIIDTVPEVEAPDVSVEAPDVTIRTPEAGQLPAEEPDVEAAAVDGPSDRQDLPPGLQRQVNSDRGLPPGLQRQVDSGRGLPPGLQR